MTLVLVAVDESDESIAAAHRARQLFGPDASYLAVNVAEQDPTWATAAPTWGGVYAYPYAATYPLIESEVATASTPGLADEARQTAHDLAHRAGLRGADATGEVGDPSTAILDAAAEHQVDVIVIGATNKSWWKRLIEGSVGKDLASRSNVPVLIAGQDA